MNATTRTFNCGRPVEYRKPGWFTVCISHVLLFLMISSPVWGVCLGGWGLWTLGAKVGTAVTERLRQSPVREDAAPGRVWRTERWLHQPGPPASERGMEF